MRANVFIDLIYWSGCVHYVCNVPSHMVHLVHMAAR